MNEKIGILLWNFLLCIAFYSIIFLIVFYGAPVHETFHYLPCKMAGLSPQISHFEVACEGIADKSHAMQFLFFMAPYIFDLTILIILYLLSSRYNYLKYLIPIPIFDTIYNYLSSLNQSDFSFLLRNTYPDMVPFTISMLIALFMLLIAVSAYFKYSISFTGIIKRFLNHKSR